MIGFVTDKGIPLVIAVLTLLTAGFGTWGAVATNSARDAEETSSTLETDLETVTAERDALDAQVDTLTSERDEWQERAEAAEATGGTDPDPDDGGTTTVGTTGPGERTSTVLRETGDQPVRFSKGYGIDLDTDAPDWGVDEGSFQADLYYGNTTNPQLSIQDISFVDHVPTEQECDDATVLQQSLGGDRTREGVQMCTVTDQDRFAYVHIADIDEENGTIALDIIVWE